MTNPGGRWSLFQGLSKKRPVRQIRPGRITWLKDGHDDIRQIGIIMACFIPSANIPARFWRKILWWTTLKKKPPAPMALILKPLYNNF
jgi:hypothetical protein